MLELNQIYNLDCMEGMKQFPDKYFELAIVDPPYGINYASTFDTRNCKPLPNRKAYIKRGDYSKKEWDNSIPTKEYFQELFRVSKNQIVWGGNYFLEHLYNTKGFIIWDKNNDLPTYADAELAWSSFNVPVKSCYFTWNGFKQAQFVGRNAPVHGNHNIKEQRNHPTQKPVALYKWLLQNYAQPGDKILDTHGGSFSSVIACLEMGFDYIAFEIDEQYYKNGLKRIETYLKQPKIFQPERVKVEQQRLF